MNKTHVFVGVFGLFKKHLAQKEERMKRKDGDAEKIVKELPKPYVVKEDLQNIKLKDKFSVFKYAKLTKGALIAYIIIMVLTNVVALARAALFAIFLEQITLLNFEIAMWYFVGVVGANFAADIMSYFSDWLLAIFTRRMVGTARKDVFNLVLQKSSRAFQENSTGRFISRMGSEQQTAIDQFITISTQGTYLLYDIMIVAYMCMLNIWIGLACLVITSIVAVVRFFMAKRRKKLQRSLKKSRDILASAQTETVKGERDIKTLNIDEEVRCVVVPKINTMQNRTYKRMRWTATSGLITNFLIDIGLLSVILLAIFLTKDYGMSVGVLLFIVINESIFWSISNRINMLGEASTDYKTSTERINELYDEMIFPDEKFGDADAIIGEPSIEFKDVGFSYKTIAERINDELYDDDGNAIKRERATTRDINITPVLSECSFKVEPYQTIGIVGKSGGGKTTILNLIAKLYEADEGQVLLGGIDIKTMTKDSLRKNIALVNQSSYIFDATIKQNLAMVKPDAVENEMLEALKSASFLDYVNTLPKRLETKVGEGGVMLSGGQRQRLSIARAFLKGSKYILFDESTSSLDNLSQNDIKESIKMLSGKHTIIVVAHRLSTVKTCDLIYFVNGGRVVAKGKFEELLETNQEFKEFFMADTF